MSDMLYEDHYRLGACYENIGDYQKAYKYYNDGYKLLLEERNQLGLSITSGFREELENNYIKFISAKTLITHVRKHSETFNFAKGKTYEEILNYFQKYLLVLHRSRHDTIEDVCNTLGISLRLYYVYSSKYFISVEAFDKLPKISIHFRRYLFSLLGMDWRSAKYKFDQDLYSFLLQKYQYNKTRIANIIKVSVLTVIKKTANLTKQE